MAPDETRLLERLLADPEFRARFRDDPRAAAAEAGVELPDELVQGGGTQTLDGRESKSSFAGALMAAAVEGIGLYELGQHVLPGADDALAATEKPAPHHDWDPAEFGQTGSGGSPTTETLDLLQNKNVTFDADGIADLRAGKIDPRIVSVLGAVAEKHKISISAMASDHDRLTAGGSVSNHYYGRAVDISVVDGRPVTPGNLAARRLAVALTNLPAGIRPSEIGSPWQLPGTADFSDGDHQNHIHIGFDDPIDRNWKPPAGSAEPSVAAAEPVDAPESSSDTDEEDADAASAIVQNAVAPTDPDDLEGNLDDEDAGVDEEDGSNEDEEDEGGGEDDDGPAVPSADDGSGDEESDGEEDEDEGQDEPGEGSSGEDATDDNADGSGDQGSDGSDASDGGSATTPDAGGAIDSDYPGDDAPQEKIAGWMGDAAEKRGLPRELPVMAALTESGMRNINYGDADSIGFFQMRTSIWDQGEYAGYGRQPEKQLDWFLDRAEEVKKQRVARSQSVDDPNQYGEWIADVERPAAQYRGRYQLRLEQARSLLGR
jgi:hypothetical protein